jgi:eukaryotic-like serine/threonine-protein kinase
MGVGSPEDGQFQFGLFRLDAVRRVLTRDGIPVALSSRLFDTLSYLVKNADRLVEKDELMNAVWAGRLVEEGNLSQTIFMLRRALKDAGEEESLIATISGRGYQITADVKKIAGSAAPLSSAREETSPHPFRMDTMTGGASARSATPDATAQPAVERGWPSFYYVGAACVLSLFVLGAIAFVRDRPVNRAPGSPNVLVLADFQNLTTDPTLGTVLGKVLEIDLGQSPFLSLMSPQQVRETLKQMERPQNAVVTQQIAQEVCARNEGRAVLSGTVAQLGGRYVVTLEARDCDSGRSIAEDHAEAGRKEEVPSVLDDLSVRIREGLSESLASIRKFNVPIASATTSSFEALKVFSVGEQMRASGESADAVTMFKRAIELDPQFAMAYEELAHCYTTLREVDLARANFEKALAFSSHASDTEKLWISANYYQWAGDHEDAVRGYRAWAQIYPLDWRPWAYLTNLYTAMARYPDAIAAGKEALRLNPHHDLPYAVLTRAYKRATRFADAKTIGREAVAKGLDGWDMHGLLYEIAFAQGDDVTMADQIRREKNKTTEVWMLDYEASAAATSGELAKARALLENAIASARAQGPDADEEVSDFYADYIEVTFELGPKGEASTIAKTDTGLERNTEGPVSFARAGDYARAEAAEAALMKHYPNSTVVNQITRRLMEALIDLGRNRPRDAILVLQPVRSYEMRDFQMATMLGRAYLDINAPEQAAAEYRKILANRGVDGLSPLYPLAWLGLARAQRMQGRLTESRATYAQLLSFWKGADSDLEALQEARREYAELDPARQSARRTR